LKKQEHISPGGTDSPGSGQKALVKQRLLTVKEASVYLGRSVASVRGLIWAGSLPIVRVGRRIHLDINDLEKWIEQNKTRYTY
jgi:excisionase family DNA binding protein